MGGPRRRVDISRMSAAALTEAAPAASSRLLADVHALVGGQSSKRAPALSRLEAALGRDFADRLVAALSNEPGEPRN